MAVDAGMAVLPSRFDNLEKIIPVILPQVGRLFVHIDRPSDLPEILDHPRIDVSMGDGQGSAMKMRGMLQSKADGFICIDDDIMYPWNYVARMRGCCERRSRELDSPVQVCVHGSIYDPRKHPRRFMGHRRMFSFWDALPRPVSVMMAGNGTTYYNRELFPTPGEFSDLLKYKNIDDVAVMKLMAERGAPTVCIPRGPSWLKGLSSGESLQHSRPLDLIDECVSGCLEALGKRFDALQTHKEKLY